MRSGYKKQGCNIKIHPFKIVLFLNAMLVLSIFSMAFYVGKLLGFTIHEIKSSEIIDHYSKYSLPTLVYDSKRQQVHRFQGRRAKILKLHQIPENVIQAFIQIEDQRFYLHNGIDYIGIARAFIKNIWHGKIVEGGSTISQQLSKLMYTNQEKNLYRKIIELWFTLHIEAQFSKSEILERYFNTLYFGHGIYSIQKASYFYFDKTLHNLNHAEIALLIAITSAPNLYSPFKNFQASRKKQVQILKTMSTRGIVNEERAHILKQTLWKKMKNYIIPQYQYPQHGIQNKNNLYFINYIKKSAKEILTAKFGYPINLNHSGYKIYTTLSTEHQNGAVKALKSRANKQNKIFFRQNIFQYKKINMKHVERMNFFGLMFFDTGYLFQLKKRRVHFVQQLSQNYGYLLQFFCLQTGYVNSGKIFCPNNFRNKNRNSLLQNHPSVQGALISIHPQTGHILAMQGGGQPYSMHNQYNRVFALRQPGSIYKIFVYGAALEKKLISSQSHINMKNKNISIKNAIQWSYNNISLYLTKILKPQNVNHFAAKLMNMNVQRLPKVLSIALGTGEVSPFEICKGAMVYANGGYRIKPIAILKIVDRHGKILYQKNKIKKERIISQNIASTMTKMLTNVVTQGSGKQARVGNILLAGKTGSTQKHKDAWFVGYTPQLVTVIWFGFDRSLVLGKNQFGGKVAAPVWKKYMTSLIHVKEKKSRKNMNLKLKKQKEYGTIQQHDSLYELI